MSPETGAEREEVEPLGTDELMEESDMDLGGEDEGGDDDLEGV
jgi:hypothetical protein